MWRIPFGPSQGSTYLVTSRILFQNSKSIKQNTFEMLRRLFDNVNSCCVQTDDNIHVLVPPLKTTNQNPSAISHLKRKNLGVDTRIESPRAICELNKCLSDPTLSKTGSKDANGMTLRHCKNCMTKYYCVYEVQSCRDFCNKDCQACYALLSGKRL